MKIHSKLGNIMVTLLAMHSCGHVMDQVTRPLTGNRTHFIYCAHVRQDGRVADITTNGVRVTPHNDIIREFYWHSVLCLSVGQSSLCVSSLWTF